MNYTVKSDTMENANGMREWAKSRNCEDRSILEAVVHAVKDVHHTHEVVMCEAEESETVLGFRNIVTAVAYLTDGGWEFHFNDAMGSDIFAFYVACF